MRNAESKLVEKPVLPVIWHQAERHLYGLYKEAIITDAWYRKALAVLREHAPPRLSTSAVAQRMKWRWWTANPFEWLFAIILIGALAAAIFTIYVIVSAVF